MPAQNSGFMLQALEFLATFFIFFVGLCVLAVVIVYILDVTQTKQAIRRNYPVVGHFRYFFEDLGKFFRQYFFAMDREEMPFNRAERSWVYRAAKDLDTTSAFGSTRVLSPPGTVLFVNCPFPTLGTDAAQVGEVTVGPFCAKPYVIRKKHGSRGRRYRPLLRGTRTPAAAAPACAGCHRKRAIGIARGLVRREGETHTSAIPVALIYSGVLARAAASLYDLPHKWKTR